MNNVQQFLTEHTHELSINETIKQLGSFDAIVFYLQAFEIWIERRRASMNKRRVQVASNQDSLTSSQAENVGVTPAN